MHVCLCFLETLKKKKKKMDIKMLSFNSFVALVTQWFLQTGPSITKSNQISVTEEEEKKKTFIVATVRKFA